MCISRTLKQALLDIHKIYTCICIYCTGVRGKTLVCCYCSTWDACFGTFDFCSVVSSVFLFGVSLPVRFIGAGIRTAFTLSYMKNGCKCIFWYCIAGPGFLRLKTLTVVVVVVAAAVAGSKHMLLLVYTVPYLFHSINVNYVICTAQCV